MSSKIEKEIAEATGVKPGRGSRNDYLLSLCKAVAGLDDKAWNALSSDAQDWYDEAIKVVNAGAKEPCPDFKDAAPAEEPRGRSRTRVREEDEPEAGPYAPKVGDRVNITTARGKNYDDVEVIEVIDKEDILAFKDGDKEIEVSLSKSTVVPASSGDNPPEEEPEAGTAFDPDGFKYAEVGDTIWFKTKRGAEKMGKVTDVDKEGFAVEYADGEKDDFAWGRIDECIIKVKGTVAEPEPSRGRQRASAEAEKPKADEKGTRTRSSNAEGVSVSGRIRELMIENPGLSLEALEKALTKEKLEFKPATVKLNWTEAGKWMVTLEKMGRLKK